MIPVETVEEFAEKNENDLRRMMVYKTGIMNKSIIDDTIQEFYVRLIQTKALETYDARLGTFKTYITSLFFWIFPVMAKRNMRSQYDMVSNVQTHKQAKMWSVDQDVWDFVNRSGGKYRIFPSYTAEHCFDEDERAVQFHLYDFIQYIRRTERRRDADRMITFLKRRYAGCKSMDIALMLKVSSNMVALIKKSVHQKYEEWKSKE